MLTLVLATALAAAPAPASMPCGPDCSPQAHGRLPHGSHGGDERPGARAPRRPPLGPVRDV